MRQIRDLLEEYDRRHPADRETIGRFRALIKDGERSLLRTHRPGHLTASAVVLDGEGRLVLLTHHRKLDIWIQLGGHADGNPDLLDAALREAREESGLVRVTPVSPRIVDLDIHPIPSHGSEGAHEHFDVRFCFQADPDDRLVVSDESHDLAWVEIDSINAFSEESSLHRAISRARAFLAGAGQEPAIS